MSKLARITVIVTLTAGIAFLGLLSGGQHPGARAKNDVDPMKGHWPVTMPSYPGAKEFPLGAQLNLGKNPMKMSYFSTRDDPLQIAHFYVGQWTGAGYHVTEDITLAGGVVAAYDPATGVLRQVLIRHRPGLTTVFPSVITSPLQLQQGAAGGSVSDVPVYPGSEGVLTFGAKDPGLRSRVTMFTNYGGVENNTQFYRDKLPELGWKEVEAKGGIPLPEDMNETLTFHKGTRELTINITRLDSEHRVRVHLAEAKGKELGLAAPPERARPHRPGGQP